MEEKSPANDEAKPFSVLERFRQLKKEKEQVTLPQENDIKQPSSSGTVFQVTSSEQGRALTPAKRNWSDNSRTERPSKKMIAQVYQGQAEVDVGITEFIRSGTAFDVILKHRYSDFVVNEIDLSGNVVKLTSTEIPKNDEGSETLVEEEDPTVLSPENWDAIREIVEKKLTTSMDIDVTDMSREKRLRIHKSLKKRFGVHVYSNTVDVDGKKVLRSGYGSKSEFNRRFCAWPTGRPEYLHFLLYKERCEVNEAIYTVAQFTHMKTNKFGYAGSKDKRAVTTQQMCVRRGDVARFKECYKLRGMAVGNFCYKWNNIRLGDLKGNRFRLALRNVKCSDEVVEEAVESLKNSGFINYFGLQRFGMSRVVPTHAIGKAILKGDWKLATELVLKPRPGEAGFKDVKDARDIWWETKDAAKALVPLTRKDRSLEGKILTGLRKHGPNAYQNAFDSLPRQTVTLYLHAVQSLVWNRVVSRRVRECGLRVLPGDLVRIPEDQLEEEEEEAEENSDGEGPPPDDWEVGAGGRIKVRALTAEEAETASISDVYYPLPGDDIRFPDNIVGTFYKEILVEEDVSIDDFSRVCMKYGSVYGTYRQMIGRADDVHWRTVHYSHPDQDLLMTDLQLLRGEPPLPEDKDGPYKALIIDFSLGVCSYATMAVRELAKCETSTHAQAKLTNQAREEDETRVKKLEEQGKGGEAMEVDCAKVEVKSKDTLLEMENGQQKPDSTSQNGDRQIENNTGALNENVKLEPDSTSQRTREEDENETKEMNKREAEADNIINKFLEGSYGGISRYTS